MKRFILILSGSILLSACNNAMKKLADSVYIQQRSTVTKAYPQVDSLLIVANGNSATQRIMEDVIPFFKEGLKKRGINAVSVFVSYKDKKINEAEFNNRNYAYTLWIYEQDRTLQKLDGYDFLVPLAMKLTENKSSDNVWIATSIFNDYVRKKYYNEKYAGTLVLLLRANGFIR